jgi:zinc transporter ZupT
MLLAVTLGDFLHNLCDGFFIGAGFKHCSDNFGWNTTLATVLHELPQEVADFAVLTRAVALTRTKALLLNGATGLSVLLGVFIVNCSDLNNGHVGLILAFSGGVFLHIAAVEAMPKVLTLPVSSAVQALSLLLFTIGVICIALILLNHEHCAGGHDESGGEDDGHGH